MDLTRITDISAEAERLRIKLNRAQVEARALAYWLDTDQDILDAMDPEALSDHQHIVAAVARIVAELSA